MLNNIAALFAGGTPAAVGDYESIATISVGSGGLSYAEFTVIPSTYKHLQIRGIARSTEAVAANTVSYRFNADTGSNYAAHILYGDGSSGSAAAFGNGSLSSMYGVQIPGASAGASMFDGMIIDILDYANTNKYKTLRSIGGSDRNGSGEVRMTSGLWINTAAITSVRITATGGNLAEYSHFALYGIKG